MDNTITNTEGLKFTFEGGYEVNALSVAKAIESLVEISTAIAEYNYPDVQFRLAVKAATPGSLNLLFLAVSQAAQHLLSPQGIQYAKSLMDLVKTSFEIKKFLNGKKPESVSASKDSTRVKNKDGSEITIPNGAGVYFFDQRVDNSISVIFQNALSAPGVEAISVTDAGGETVKIGVSEFKTCATPLKIGSEEESKILEVERKNETLFIRKPDLLGESQWGLKSDKYFLADIEDKEFLEKVKTGQQPMVAKMYIVADLQIVMQLGKDGLPDENKCRYTVKKVHSVHIPDEGQSSFL